VSVRAGLARLAGALAVRRALALVLGALVVLGAAGALAAMAAGLGWLAFARWLPLLLWAGAVVIVGRALRGGARAARTDAAALREAARLVEEERRLRRGSVVGLVDLAAGAVPGTSADLAASADARVVARLPAAASDPWAPGVLGVATAMVRRRGAAAAVAVVAAVVAFAWAGDAAAALRSPVHAWRHAWRPRLALTLGAASARPGERVAVEVRAEPGTPRVAVYTRATGEPWRPIIVEADPAGRATHLLPALRGTTWVYAAAGGAVSETLTVRLLQPLVIGGLAVTARYPGYLDREDEDLDPGAGPMMLPVGTVLRVRGAASAALAGARLEAAADTVGLATRGAAFGGDLPVRAAGEWRLVLAGRDGAAPADTAVLRVVAVPDSAPVVAVPVPGGDTTAPLDLRALLLVDARDDHGLGRVEIVSWRVSRLGIVGDTLVDTLAGVAGADRLVQSVLLDLTGRGLLPGDTLRYFARALDRAPRPRAGVSPTYALRLRSMAEMREAARREADSLAQAAGALARDQGGLSRQTQDLAAQRNRESDRAPARPADAQRSAERAAESPAQGQRFEQQAEAQRVLEQQQALVQRAESLRTELEHLARAAEEAGLNDPEWQRQLQRLEQLLREAMTPELERAMEDLRRALEQLDPRAIQDALRRMAEQQRALREELERSAELFERAAIEGAMETFARQADALEREQREWDRRAAEVRDTAAAADAEERMQAEADTLAARLDSLAARIAARGDTATARAVRQAAAAVAEASRGMEGAQQAMRQGRRDEAARSGERSADRLSDVERSLDDARSAMAANWRAEVLRMLGRSTREAVELASAEQRIAEEMRRGTAGNQETRGRQAAVEAGISQLTRQLQESAGRNALVSPRLGATLAQARDLARQSREAMEGPSPSPEDAAERAGQAAQLLSAAAMQMMRAAEDVGGAESGSGFAEAVQRLAQLAGEQGQLNDQLGGMLPMLGSGQDAIQLQLRMLAQQQRRLAAELERLGTRNLPGRPEQLAEEARQLADRIERGRLDRATLERQQRLFRRLLDAGRTLQNEDEPEDPERRSRTATAGAPAGAPDRVARPGTVRYPAPSWEALRSLAPADRAMVLDYFRRLNAQPR
jgi:hypothetical protein